MSQNASIIKGMVTSTIVFFGLGLIVFNYFNSNFANGAINLYAYFICLMLISAPIYFMELGCGIFSKDKYLKFFKDTKLKNISKTIVYLSLFFSMMLFVYMTEKIISNINVFIMLNHRDFYIQNLSEHIYLISILACILIFILLASVYQYIIKSIHLIFAIFLLSFIMIILINFKTLNLESLNTNNYYYLHTLSNLNMWIVSCTLAIFTIGSGFGILFFLGSENKNKFNIKTSYIMTILMALIFLIASVIIVTINFFIMLFFISFSLLAISALLIKFILSNFENTNSNIKSKIFLSVLFIFTLVIFLILIKYNFNVLNLLIISGIILSYFKIMAISWAYDIEKFKYKILQSSSIKLTMFSNVYFRVILPIILCFNILYYILVITFNIDFYSPLYEIIIFIILSVIITFSIGITFSKLAKKEASIY